MCWPSGIRSPIRAAGCATGGRVVAGSLVAFGSVALGDSGAMGPTAGAHPAVLIGGQVECSGQLSPDRNSGIAGTRHS